MPDLTVLVIFIPTFFFISITPGMCMSLAMTLGMAIGVRKTLWMMLGEVVGVALVAILAVIGVANMMLQYPRLFIAFKWIGASYLVYLGLKMWATKVHIDNSLDVTLAAPSRSTLISKGFITAVANPKGWAFMISLLPPFISIDNPIAPQLFVLVIIIMLSEFFCMLLYANGGKGLRTLLNKGNKAQWINRIGGSLLVLVGVWLALS